MSLFSLDSRLIKFLFYVGNIITLSFYWFLFSLPIITIGASSSALYYTYNKSIVNNRGYIWNEFFKAFKSNFFQSTICELIVAGLYLFAIADFYILIAFTDKSSNPKWNYIIFAVIIGIISAINIYVFPSIARFENKTLIILKNSLLMALFNLPNTIFLLLIYFLSVVIIIGFPPILLFVPALYTLISHKFLEKIFRKYMSEEDKSLEDERNKDYCDGN